MVPEPPAGPTRRRFLTGVVGSAVAAAGATVAAVSIGAMTSSRGSGGGRVPYRGMRNVTGPAPRALPQVPVAVDEEGFLRGIWPAATTDGVPVATLGGVRYSADWFRYCGFADRPAFTGDAERDTYLRAAPYPPYEWQATAYDPGERLHVSDFSDYESWENGVGTPGLGKPAMATWRSREAHTPFRVQVLRSARVPALREGDAWLRASTDREFIACAAHCTYGCAATAFKAYGVSEKFDAGDLIYCPDHQSLFDPFDVVAGSFVAPAMEDEER